MFIDFVSLMLVNMSAGYFIIGIYIYTGVDKLFEKKWIPVFTITGLIALFTGFHMIFSWPLPGPYNMAFGEMSVMLGMLFLGAALSILNKWDLIPLSYYGIFAGIAAIIIGLSAYNKGV